MHGTPYQKYFYSSENDLSNLLGKFKKNLNIFSTIFHWLCNENMKNYSYSSPKDDIFKCKKNSETIFRIRPIMVAISSTASAHSGRQLGKFQRQIPLCDVYFELLYEWI